MMNWLVIPRIRELAGDGSVGKLPKVGGKTGADVSGRACIRSFSTPGDLSNRQTVQESLCLSHPQYDNWATLRVMAPFPSVSQLTSNCTSTTLCQTVITAT